MATLTVNIEQFKSGNRQSFDSVYCYYSRVLTHFAMSYVRDRELAEELMSNSMLKLWHHRLRIERPEQIKAFLFIATKNACIDALRSQNILSRSSPLSEELYDLMNEEPAVYNRILYSELLQQIEQAVATLPKSQQLVFRKCILEGKTTDEVMLETGMTIASIFSQKSKAIAKLRALLKDNLLLIILLCIKDN